MTKHAAEASGRDGRNLTYRMLDRIGRAIVTGAHDATPFPTEADLAAEAGDDDTLDADIAFHVAILEACGNPFYRQFPDLIETALRTSIRFTDGLVGQTADLHRHRTVLAAIERRDADAAGRATAALIVDVRRLIAAAEQGS